MNEFLEKTIDFPEDFSVYRKKLESLADKFEKDLKLYKKERDSFFSVNEVESDISDSGDEDDLFVSLLEEMGVSEDEKTEREKIEVKISFKKIIDKNMLERAVNALKAEFEIYGKILADFYSEALYEPQITEDMEFLELRDAVTGVYHGVIPLIVLEQKLTAFYSKCTGFLDRLSDFPEEGDLKEIKEKLERQKKAFLEINAYFDKPDKKHLVKGLEELEETADCLIRANEIISSREVEKNFVTCFRCSGKNPPGLQLCNFCKAVLPFSEVSASSIEVSETGQVADLEADVKNEDVKYFKRLLSRFSKGVIKKSVLNDYIEKFSLKVSSSKSNFEKTMRPFLVKNPDVDELKDSYDKFLAAFDEFSHALNEGKKFFEDEDREHLKSCLSMLVDADSNMQNITKEIEVYMEKYSPEKESQYRTSRLNKDFVPE